MKEYDNCASRLMANVKYEHVETWKEGVEDRTLEGELGEEWSFHIDIHSDIHQDMKYTQVSLERKIPKSYFNKKVDIAYLSDVNLPTMTDYIMGYEPSTDDKDPYDSNSSLDSLHMLQYHLCYWNGYSSYKVEVMSDYRFKLTLYTYCYSISIEYNLDSRMVWVCFHPKDDKYFLCIKYPMGMYHLDTIIRNWEMDYYGKQLKSHSEIEPEEEEEE